MWSIGMIFISKRLLLIADDKWLRWLEINCLFWNFMSLKSVLELSLYTGLQLWKTSTNVSSFTWRTEPEVSWHLSKKKVGVVSWLYWSLYNARILSLFHRFFYHPVTSKDWDLHETVSIFILMILYPWYNINFCKKNTWILIFLS